mmetsp:Transcript_27462/g.65038  ORF Transcript_27462/g.65038 Transcript_27462/m.65038 type:complete len:147 (-) Transcript_27462:16-456(-)
MTQICLPSRPNKLIRSFAHSNHSKVRREASLCHASENLKCLPYRYNSRCSPSVTLRLTGGTAARFPSGECCSSTNSLKWRVGGERVLLHCKVNCDSEHSMAYVHTCKGGGKSKGWRKWAGTTDVAASNALARLKTLQQILGCPFTL